MEDKRQPDFYEELIEITEEQMKKAKSRLDENLKKEAEDVDPRYMFLKLKKAFLEQYGRINAANIRANDNLAYINALDKNLARFKAEIYEKLENFEEYNHKVEEYTKKICKQVVDEILQDKLKELDSQSKDIQKQLDLQKKIFCDVINVINEYTQPWYKKLWKKVISRN